MESFLGKKVLVYGMGTSGKSACRLLHKLGACISVFDDSNKFDDLFCFEKNPYSSTFDFVVISPGVKIIGNKLIEFYKKNNVELLSELDLGYMFCKGKMIAVTGTNGKTTTCSLLGEIFKLANKEVFVCGNIGLPITQISQDTSKRSLIVCEVSNFQLELSKYFNPQIAVITNLKEDHIDRHGNFAEYVRIKNLITQNFSSKNFLIANKDDENLKLVNLPDKAGYFSKKEQNNGVYIKEDVICFDKKKIIECKDIKLIGEKNLENVLACVYIASMLKIKPDIIKDAIVNFKTDKYRIELFYRKNGVHYFDDSKATNIASVKNALSCFKNNFTILLVGGRNKGGNFEDLFLKEKPFKMVICFGECAEEIALACKKCEQKFVVFKTLEEASNYAKTTAEKGDFVVLSPGCASFDEFEDYKQRGDSFKKFIKGI